VQNITQILFSEVHFNNKCNPCGWVLLEQAVGEEFSAAERNKLEGHYINS
jgi:ribosomal protein S27E